MKSLHYKEPQCGYLVNLVALTGVDGTGALSRVYITIGATKWRWRNSTISFLCTAISGYKQFLEVGTASVSL